MAEPLTNREVLDALDRYGVAAASRERGPKGEVLVTLGYTCTPAESTRALKEIAELLTREGYSCFRSRTRVSVMRAGEREPVGQPDFICRRGP